MSARVISSWSPTSVASSNICLPVKGLVSPSWTIASSALRVAHAEAEARLRQQVRRLRHRLHAAADADLEVAGADRGSSTPAARMPDAQTLLIVSEETSFGMPALICAWRDGICPWPACSTWPITTCCTCSGSTSARSSAALDRDAAELGGMQGRQAAAELADGVRAAPRITVRACRSESSEPSYACRDASRRHHRRPARHRRRHHRDRASSRASRSPTTSRAACSRRWSTPARPAGPAQARGHPCRRAALRARRARHARRVRRRARPRRRRLGRRPRRASSGRATLCWELPHHVGDAVAGGFVEGTLLAAYAYRAYKTSRDEDGSGSSSSRSPPTTTSPTAVQRAAASPRRPTPRATSRTRRPTS